MKLVFLGPPGAGKGTQAGSVSRALSIPHISTGDMFRAAIGQQTPVGLKAKAFIDAGKLVPDSVVIEMVEERLAQSDCAGGYLLDGFPRTVSQAEALALISEPDAVVNIVVEDEKLLDRLSGRRVCLSCKGTFHISRLEDEKVCPDCGSELIHRADDRQETVKERLSVYHTQTSPLTSYYQDKGILRTVDGALAPDKVHHLILKALEREV
ncbi:MAG: adenylate kinase [Clostridia bacterium]